MAGAYFDNGHPEPALEAEKKASALRPKDEKYHHAVKNYEEIAEATKKLPASTELENWYVPVPMLLLPSRCLHLIRRLRKQFGW